jgi:hypothetical protein
MRDNELREYLANIESSLLKASGARKAEDVPPPVLFQGYCEQCGKQTTHRSYISALGGVYTVATSTAVPLPIPYKTCLECGTTSYK